MAGASQNPQAPPETMQLTEEQSDAPTNAGVSMASATSHSSDLADESAVQNLDVGCSYKVQSYVLFNLSYRSIIPKTMILLWEICRCCKCLNISARDV